MYEFEVYCVRFEGRIRPRHLLWTDSVRGEFRVRDEYFSALARHVKVATIERRMPHAVLLKLHDPLLISAKSDLWTITGWELVPESTGVAERACAQSWIMVPAELADTEREEATIRRANLKDDSR